MGTSAGHDAAATVVLPSSHDDPEFAEPPGRIVGGRGGHRHRVVRWGVVITTAVVVVTIAIALMSAVLGGWQPVGDEAVIAIRSADTFSAHPPLVGPPTTLGAAVGRDVSHPGPLQFWLLAPFVQVFGPQGVLIGTAVLNMAWVVATVAVAWRHAGPWFALLTAAFVAVLVSALGGQMLRDPYNPWTAVMPTVLCAVLCWTATSGVRWALPAAVAVASVAAQAHVSFVVVPTALVLAAVVMVVSSAVRDRGRLDARSWRRETSGVVWSLGSSVVVGVVCWIGPIIDQFTGRGNLGELFLAGGGDSERVGWDHARYRAIEMLRWPPHWLDRPGTLDLVPVSGVDAMTALMTIVALIGLCVWGYRAGEVRLARLVVVAGVAMLASTYTTGMIVRQESAWLSTSNRLDWWSSAMVAWLVLVWGCLLVGRRIARRGTGRLTARRSALAVAVVAAVLAAVLAPRALDDVAAADDPQSGYFGPAVHLADAIADEPGDGPYTLDDTNPFAQQAIVPAVIAQLQARGIDVHVPDRLLHRLGGHREITGDEIGAIVLHTGADAAEPAGGQAPLGVFDPADPPDGFERYEGYTNVIFGQLAMPWSVVVIAPLTQPDGLSGAGAATGG